MRVCFFLLPTSILSEYRKHVDGCLPHASCSRRGSKGMFFLGWPSCVRCVQERREGKGREHQCLYALLWTALLWLPTDSLGPWKHYYGPWRRTARRVSLTYELRPLICIARETASRKIRVAPRIRIYTYAVFVIHVLGGLESRDRLDLSFRMIQALGAVKFDWHASK